MKKYVPIILGLGAISFIGWICPATAQSQSAGTQAMPQQQAAAEILIPVLPEPQLEAWNFKLKTYTALYNRTARGLESWWRYKKSINPKTGPTGRETLIYDFQDLPDDILSDVAAKAAQAAASAPRIEALDRIAADYVSSLETLVPVLHEAHGYYSRRDYSDDKFALARQMHPRLVAAFTDFEAKRAAFSTALSAAKGEIDSQLLGYIEKTEGRNYRWYAKRITVASLEAVKTLASICKKEDLPKLNEAIWQYGAVVREYDAFASVAGDAPKSGRALKDLPDQLLASLRGARDALENKNVSSFTTYADLAVSLYNVMVQMAGD